MHIDELMFLHLQRATVVQHMQPARSVCALAVWGPLACLAHPLQAWQERAGMPAGSDLECRRLQGRQDLRTNTLCATVADLEREANAIDAGTGVKEGTDSRMQHLQT